MILRLRDTPSFYIACRWHSFHGFWCRPITIVRWLRHRNSVGHVKTSLTVDRTVLIENLFSCEVKVDVVGGRVQDSQVASRWEQPGESSDDHNFSCDSMPRLTYTSNFRKVHWVSFNWRGLDLWGTPSFNCRPIDLCSIQLGLVWWLLAFFEACFSLAQLLDFPLKLFVDLVWRLLFVFELNQELGHLLRFFFGRWRGSFIFDGRKFVNLGRLFGLSFNCLFLH